MPISFGERVSAPRQDFEEVSALFGMAVRREEDDVGVFVGVQAQAHLNF